MDEEAELARDWLGFWLLLRGVRLRDRLLAFPTLLPLEEGAPGTTMGLAFVPLGAAVPPRALA